MDETRSDAADLLPRRPETRPTNETENHRVMTGIIRSDRTAGRSLFAGRRANNVTGSCAVTPLQIEVAEGSYADSFDAVEDQAPSLRVAHHGFVANHTNRPPSGSSSVRQFGAASSLSPFLTSARYSIPTHFRSARS